MRGLFYALSAIAVMGLAFWAYRENYRTQQSLRDVAALQSQIGDLREALAVQRAEWAYLNRPERLRELAELNWERLNLIPLSPDHFGDLQLVVFADEAPANLLPADEDEGDDAPAMAGLNVSDAVAVRGTLGGEAAR
ncbi:hypothetical protein BV394_13170 [Brevirhabdus pacifica]|uniref:Uncharacterized protein n=1 Tax=Brevirhabdus pacifica TaxID=1267768 RepID=A0A1U7DKY9_9RHOB|nr:hypothetical protein [Brevirhabdus pacifica]APX90549.1 hypothetical protein BV394_13170 [Brevirhabdus pacifica]PJJ85323.1 hypothetical protein CLV77_2189 [Brevirhabdus pacifica]